MWWAAFTTLPPPRPLACPRLPRFGGEGLRWGWREVGGVLRGWQAMLDQSCHELALGFSVRTGQSHFWNSLENFRRLGISYLQYSRRRDM